MCSEDTCRHVQEEFPLLFSGQITEDSKRNMIDHILHCLVCRTRFKQERALFGLAAATSQAGLLSNHPEIDQLDLYVSAPERLSGVDRTEISDHVKSCQLCREVADHIRILPSELSELVSSEDIPFISELDREFPATKKEKHQRRTVSLISANWLRGLAAAAVVVLVAVLLVPRGEEAAVIRARFPMPTRSLSSTQVFETTDRVSEFHGRVFVDPEEDHRYRIAIIDKSGDSTITVSDENPAVDQQGFARFEMPLPAGDYNLVLYDILDNDTIQTSYPFEIRLK